MNKRPFTNTIFGDARLSLRANSVIQKIVSSGASVINRVYTTMSEKVGAYRLLNNDRVSIDSIIKAYYEDCRIGSVQSDCEHVLCLQDTCEINYEAHSKRMHKDGKSPGIVSNNETGCFLHACLAINAGTCLPLGFSYLKMWNREEGGLNSKERKYKALPRSEKESIRWSDAIDQSEHIVSNHRMTTVISDRESDIYDVLSRGNETLKILLRSNQRRRIMDDSCNVHEYIRKQPVRGNFKLTIPHSHDRRERVAKMQVQFTEVHFRQPANTRRMEYPVVCLNCIRVSEVEDSCPQDEEPVEWILLTNHEVTSVEQALKCVAWYRCRWYIEEFFRLLKKKGFAIEDIQLEKVQALEKNILLVSYATMLTITLKQAFDKPEAYKQVHADLYFSEDEVETAYLISSSVNGRTKITTNPFPEKSLPWMAWIIARLGKWSGYLSQSRPGYTTFKRGLDNLYSKSELLKIVKNVYKG